MGRDNKVSPAQSLRRTIRACVPARAGGSGCLHWFRPRRVAPRRHTHRAAAASQTAAFLAKSPLGKVPVLETADGCLCEAGAIARCAPPARVELAELARIEL